MGLRINQNVEAMNAYRHLTDTNNTMSKSLERLSSGLRINRASDDAAGLSISEKLRSQIGGFKVATQNAQDGISMLQTAEGALNETTSLLQRIRDLAVQAANGTQDTASRTAADSEVQQNLNEIDRIAKATSYGNLTLLNAAQSFTFQVGGTTQSYDQIAIAVVCIGTDTSSTLAPIRRNASAPLRTIASTSASALGASKPCLSTPIRRPSILAPSASV